MFNGKIKIEEAFSLHEEPEQERTESSDVSSYGNDSDDEDYIPDEEDDFSMNEEENVDDVNHVPDLSVSSAFTWEKRDVVKSNPHFISRTGPSDEVLALMDPSPVAIFLLLLRMDFIERIVSQTNLYATQMQKPFTPLELKEFLRFLAINLLMGIKRLPSYRDYWSSDPDLNDPFISRQLSVKRFSWILSHLHLNDNSLQPKRGAPGYDKLYKLRPLISELSEKFLSALHPHENQVIGVSAAKFRPRCGLKPKIDQTGYKIWLRCDESGYACQFDICTGKAEEPPGENVAERVEFVTDFMGS
ncbi:piggyBac transposable element-derived protein 3-like [Uloborus diversus]|uniref:piggyBac transposable element-derived protein 3-like n=1 Tax=Uloborus diversus TaxID=327109 RepID=UPI002409FEED|nr:piggyBac transposable element-derived protein 3-like [Uloborus diversus]